MFLNIKNFDLSAYLAANSDFPATDSTYSNSLLRLECVCNHIYCFDCVKHWNLWSEERYKELETTIDETRLKYYIGRFDYPDIYDPEKVASLFLKLTNSIFLKFDYSKFIWVNHIDSVWLHRHYLFAFPFAIDMDYIRSRWRRLTAKYCIQPLNKMGLMVNEADNPKGHLRYMLGIDYKRNPYVLMPWRDSKTGAVLRTHVCDGSALYKCRKEKKTASPLTI